MSSPRDIKMALPEGGRIPRVGKLRLGVKIERMRDDNSTFTYPSAVDYFVVNEDASTNRQSAESFAEVYGPEPRELDVVLPAPTTEDVLEGAWRLYGTGGKLKCKCSGPGGECVARDDAGDWQGPMPCACEANSVPLEVKNKKGDTIKNPAHCQQRWTLTVMLMRVQGVGCWQLDTGSQMAAEGLTASLRMLEQFRGHLQGAQATLRVVPRQVAPEGKAKTVYIVELGSLDITPQQALALASERAGRVALPASSLDDEPDALLDGEVVDIATGEITSGEAALDDDPVTIPSIAKGKLGEALKALNANQRETLFAEVGITMKDGKVDPPVTMAVTRGLLAAKWDELGLPDYGDGEPVPVTLLGAIYAARTSTVTPADREEFENFIRTGESIEPGQQVEFNEVMT